MPLSIALDGLASHVGRELGVSPWVGVDQRAIDAFAAVTGEDHWTHTNPERCRRESPTGTTTAPGFLTAAHITGLMRQVVDIQGCSRFLNYGLDRLRFTAPVVPGSRLRLRQTLKAVDALADGALRVTTACVIELEGSPKPALVADFIFVAIPDAPREG